VSFDENLDRVAGYDLIGFTWSPADDSVAFVRTIGAWTKAEGLMVRAETVSSANTPCAGDCATLARAPHVATVAAQRGRVAADIAARLQLEEEAAGARREALAVVIAGGVVALLVGIAAAFRCIVVERGHALLSTIIICQLYRAVPSPRVDMRRSRACQLTAVATAQVAEPAAAALVHDLPLALEARRWRHRGGAEARVRPGAPLAMGGAVVMRPSSHFMIG
jgi:hypothetical protein